MLNNVICCDISVLEYTCLMCTYQDKSGLPVFPLPLQFTFLISPALTFTCEKGSHYTHLRPRLTWLHLVQFSPVLFILLQMTGPHSSLQLNNILLSIYPSFLLVRVGEGLR